MLHSRRPSRPVSSVSAFPLPSRLSLAVLGTLGLKLALVAAPAQATPEGQTPTVEVIGITPLPGIGLPRQVVPANVQTASSEELRRSGAVDLADYLVRNLGSVDINEVQGNLFQPDINYRGYTASPLLGTAQGLSVYVDGVRFNQPLGDVVNWDLLPRNAIDSLSLMPGSNPLFGLNTLGGALSLTTKDGRKHAGTSVEALAGSYGRRSLGFEHGGQAGNGLHWFVTGNSHHENGWRDESPSRLGQLFGKLGWADARTDLSLTMAYANNRLYGNGMQEVQLLEQDRRSVFTKPDITDNRAGFLNLEARHSLSDTLSFAGNAYYRHTRTKTFNGDLNEEALGEGVYYTGQNGDRTWLQNNGYAPTPESTNSRSSAANNFPMWRCIAQAGSGGEPNEKCTGLLNQTHSKQRNYGLSGQFTWLTGGPDYSNQLVLGGGYDESRIRFNQSTQFGYLNPDRSVTPVPAWADGTQDSENAFDQRVDLTGRIRTWSLFASDTLSLAQRWHLTLAGRYNQSRMRNSDHLFPYNNATTQGEQRGSLDGDHRFQRFNPAIGLSFTPTPTLGAFIGYSESSRAPTAIELGCADPNFGCRLPNAMAGDPPLRQVVAKTWEAGLRGSGGGFKHWQATVYRAENHDDIMFVANSAATGYFRNIGKTRREGLELGASRDLGKLSLSANFSLLRATYQTAESLLGAYHSGADASGAIHITPGKRLPLLPARTFKLRAEYPLTASIDTGIDLLAVSATYVRGNEDNSYSADNSTYFGSGKVPGHAVVNWSGNWQANKQTRVFANISNLFDRHYATAGQLGPYAITASGGFSNVDGRATTFYTPGAPRTVWLGLRHSF